jgi:hypothetical protein
MITKETAQEQLNLIGPLREFTVVFTKKNGETRKITGFMEVPSGELKEAVPVKVTEGDAAGQWRSFRLDSVVEIT